jgi:hypothetical protein
VPRQVRVPGVHEVPPVGLHLAGQLLLVCTERRTEIEQELQFRSMFRSVGSPYTSLGSSTAVPKLPGSVD